MDGKLDVPSTGGSADSSPTWKVEIRVPTLDTVGFDAVAVVSDG